MRLRSVLLTAALLAGSIGAPRPAVGEIGSDHPAAILVFPKLIIDTANGLDTMIRISNVSESAINVYCFYVNASPRCSLGLQGASSCFPDRRKCFGEFEEETVAGDCLPQWQETDFTFQLTRDQPTGWLVSHGESTESASCAFIDGVCSNDGTTRCDSDTECPQGKRCVKPPCLPLDGGPLGRVGPGGDVNVGAVPLSPEDPFIGELKCIAVDTSLAPVPRNDLIGEVLIGRLQSGPDQAIELAGYNAIGIPALINICQPNGACSLTGTACRTNLNCEPTNNRDNTLKIGGQNVCQPDKLCSMTGTTCMRDADCPLVIPEYEGCPNILILDHYFDGAVDPIVTNFCEFDGPEGTCSVSGTPCENDNDCVDNICLDGTCSVTHNTCKGDAGCENTCGPTNVCTLSGEHCLSDEDCTEPVFQTRVVTSVTLIPCTEDFETQQPQLSRSTAQFLVFNEFEQRFSTSIPIECFKETRLSSIDTEQNPRSIFSAGVGGTLTGQTRIRGAENKDPKVGTRPAGNALLGVAEEFRCGGPKFQFPLCNFVDDPEDLVSATAKNLHIQGRRPQSDFIYLPQQ